MLGLADQVGGQVTRVGRAVGDHDDLAGPGDAVDVDRAVDVPLGQRDEQVARSDDLVDRSSPIAGKPYARAATPWAPPIR